MIETIVVLSFDGRGSGFSADKGTNGQRALSHIQTHTTKSISRDTQSLNINKQKAFFSATCIGKHSRTSSASTTRKNGERDPFARLNKP